MTKKIISITTVAVMFFTMFFGQLIASAESVASKVVSVAAGDEHSVALKDDGSVWVWGSNSYGQLGDGTKEASKEPKELSAISNVTAIAANCDHTLALKSDGTVWAWGDNAYGQLGNGTEIDSKKPVQVSGLADINAISAGGAHCVALKNDGTVWTWGRNFYGQLGDYTTKNSSNPVQVVGISDVVAISAGERHTLALLKDGTVWAWGSNDYGELGDGSDDSRNRPVEVADLSNVKSIAAGNVFSSAVKGDGTTWVWGYNEYGQLGNGTTENSLKPIKVDGLNDAKMVTAGRYHMLALKNDGTVWSWGYNSSGQLGDGSKDQSAIPNKINGIKDVTSIITTSKHNIAIKSDGSIWAWGNNFSSQIGEKFNSEVLMPVQVISPPKSNSQTNTNTSTSMVQPTIDLIAVPLRDSTIDLSWDVENIDDVDGYYVYRSNKSGNYEEPLMDFPLLKREYIDKKVEPGKTYYYIVKAVLINRKQSNPSNEVVVSPKKVENTLNTLENLKVTIILQIDNPMMLVNGTNKEIDPGNGTAPTIIDGRTMVPIRAIIEELGGKVDWGDKERKVTITLENKKIELWINKKTINVNGTNKDIDVEPQILKDRTMLPLRFVVDNLGYDSDWDDLTKKITITPKDDESIFSEEDNNVVSDNNADNETNLNENNNTNNENSAQDNGDNTQPVMDKDEIKGGTYYYDGEKVFSISGSLDWAAMSPNGKYVVYRDGQYIEYYDIDSKESVNLYTLTTDEYMGKYVYNYGFTSPTNYDFVCWADDSSYVVVKRWTNQIFKGGEGNYKINLTDKIMTPMNE